MKKEITYCLLIDIIDFLLSIAKKSLFFIFLRHNLSISIARKSQVDKYIFLLQHNILYNVLFITY